VLGVEEVNYSFMGKIYFDLSANQNIFSLERDTLIGWETEIKT